MAEITKIFRESVPAMRFIGKNIPISASGGANGSQTVGFMKLRSPWAAWMPF